MRPINTVVIGRLYFNKTLFQFEDCLRRMLAVAQASGIVSHLHIETTEGMAVDMARNQIVERALTTHNADAVIWLDTDMIYPDDAFCRLVQMHQACYPIAAAVFGGRVGAGDYCTGSGEVSRGKSEKLTCAGLERTPGWVNRTPSGSQV